MERPLKVPQRFASDFSHRVWEWLCETPYFCCPMIQNKTAERFIIASAPSLQGLASRLHPFDHHDPTRRSDLPSMKKRGRQ
jgi:hypothetical protein